MRNLGVIIQCLIIFLSVIIISSLAGNVLGFVAGGSFSDTYENFGNTTNNVYKFAIKPFKDFMKFFGLNSYSGGNSLMYRREASDDYFISHFPEVPDNAYYCSWLLSLSFSGDYKSALIANAVNFYIFYDADGLPISAFVTAKNNYYELGSVMPGGLVIHSLNVERSFFNSLSKYEYVDLTFEVSYSGLPPVSYTISYNTALLDYQYMGDFQEFLYLFAR